MKNKRIVQKAIAIIFLIAFSFSNICCMDLHLTSWREVKCDNDMYPMHKGVAELVAKARYRIKSLSDSSNISIIGITVKASDDGRHYAHFGILSSALNSDGSKAETIDTVQVVTVPDMLRGEPIFAVMGTDSSEITRTHKLKAILSHIEEGHSMRAKMGAIMAAINAKIALNQKLDVVGTIGEKTSVQRDIGALLHCEQITLLKILDSKWVLLPIVMKLVEETSGNEIEGITLDIFTYNDMCKNCFSTCDKQFEQLKDSIIDVFKLVKKADENFVPTFNICISSFRPYQSGAITTRTLKSTYGEPCSQILDRAFCSQGLAESSDARIIQFVNPWIFGHLIHNELADIIAAVNALKEEDLMKSMIDMERLMKRYGDIKKLIDTKQAYILDKYGYNLAINHENALNEVLAAINLKRANVRRRAQQLADNLAAEV